jgi:hypothetical protein
MTAEEFYVVAAIVGAPPMTAKQLGLSPVDDFELHSMLCCEHETRHVYINPELTPPEPLPEPDEDGVHQWTAGLRFGAAPEELRLSALRPEQREFFKKHLPDVYARLKRD